MQIQFNHTPVRCMRPVLTQNQFQEQTQEIKLPDGYPDIGRILGCHGQIVLRGKEWRRTSMGANGGVMAWVAYAPEDGSQPRYLDAWIPFQVRWDLPEAVEDGVFTVAPMVCELDARNVSARKIMVRSGVDILGQAMEYCKLEIPDADAVPEDIQLLIKNYPVDLPMEAGEQQIHVEENLTVPVGMPAVSKVIGCRLIPSVSEQKVLANRLVFRGKCLLQLRYLTEDGEQQLWQTELPISNYTELRNEYDTTVTAWIVPAVTALETELNDMGQLVLRADISGQYTVFDRMLLKIVEDAYSPHRDVQPQVRSINVPALLDQRELVIPIQTAVGSDMDRFEAPMVLYRQPYVTPEEDGLIVGVSGEIQIVGQDREGAWICDNLRFDEHTSFAGAYENRLELWPGMTSFVDYGGSAVTGEIGVTAFSYQSEPMNILTGIEIGELKPADAHRPSVVVKRAGEEDLWTLARQYGSTVDAICKANQISDEPHPGMMLLIPVC